MIPFDQARSAPLRRIPALTPQALEFGSHFFQKPFRGNLECLRQPERHLNGRGSQSFLQPGAFGNALNGVGLGTIDYFTEVVKLFHPFGDPNRATGADLNGILGNNEGDHQAVADASRRSQFFGSSNGAIADVVQTFWGIVLFGLGVSMAQSIGEAIHSLPPAARANIVAHSQATVHLTNAVMWGHSPAITATLNSPAIPSIRPAIIGALNDSTFHYNQPFGDVATLYSFNLNPFSIAAGLYLPRSINVHLGNTLTNLNLSIQP